TLGVPDNTNPSIAFWRSRTKRVLHSFIDGMKLVISGDLLFYRASGVLKDNEMPDQVEKTLLLEHATNRDFEFQRSLRRDDISRNRAPRHEAFPARRERSDPRL